MQSKNRKVVTACGVLAAAAVTGLFSGLAHADSTRSDGITNRSVVSIAVDSAGSYAGLSSAEAGKHDCKGQNSCSGQGGCKSGDNGCKGKNSCKGKGGCSGKE